MFDLGSVIAHVKADITDFQKGMGQVQKDLGGLGQGIQNLGNQATIFTGVLGAGLLLVGKQGLESAAKFEQYQVAFNTLLKDRAKAAEAIKNIQEDAAKTPFELAPLVAANSRLISAGVSAKEARIDIINLGNAIAATGGGGAELERLSVNLQQIKAVGKASALDIKQFAFAGINVYKLLADATGKSVEEVKEMDVSYELLAESFAKASRAGGMFEGAMQNQSRTLNGLMSTLRDTISIGLKDIFVDTGLFDAIRNSIAAMIPFLTDAVPKIVAFFSAIPNNPTVVAIFTMLQAAFTKLSDWISENKDLVISALEGIAVAIGALIVIGTVNALLVAILNPLTLVGAAVVALYMLWKNNVFGIKDITEEAFTGVISFFNESLMPAISKLTKFVKDHWTEISTITKDVADFIVGYWQLTSGVMLGVLRLLFDVLTGNWKRVGQDIKDINQSIMDGTLKIFSAISSAMGGIGNSILESMTRPFRQAWEIIDGIMKKIAGATDMQQRHSPSIVDRIEAGVNAANRAFQGLQVPNFATPSSGAAAMASGGSNGVASSTIINQTNMIYDQIDMDAAMGDISFALKMQ